MVAVGLAFITFSGHYVDLSIPGIMAFSGIVAITALKYGIVVSLSAGMLAGMAIGLINGLVIGYLRVNPIIWTLAMMSALGGVVRWVYGGKQLYPDRATEAGRAFLDLYHVQLFASLPLIGAILIVLAILGCFLMWKTAFGARLRLTGSSYEVAAMTGVNVRRTVAIAFVLSAAASAIAGILLTSFNKVGAMYIGRGYDFGAVTAVVIGGMALAGGRGNIIGVIGGVMAIGLMNNVMSLVRIENFTIGIGSLSVTIREFTIGTLEQAIVQGAIFILVVGLHSYSLRRSGKDDA
jgi:ribose/xylose/arabinose/galactoside ABC-type transport system permease subunit